MKISIQQQAIIFMKFFWRLGAEVPHMPKFSPVGLGPKTFP